MPPSILTGLDLISRRWPRRLRGSRVGLVVHPASVNKSLTHSSQVLMHSSFLKLRAFFGPQHGIRGETQDNMIEWEGFRDKITGLPVYSLYGEVRKPSKEMLQELDVVVVDLQDVGARYYTFIWTMALIMDACREMRKTVVVLDRPNPLGGVVIEGPVLGAQFSSFVGLYSLPVRHGMTIGEIASFFKNQHYRDIDLHIIGMKDWNRRMWFDETGQPWVLPSPNMPTLDTAIVYPGMCLLEGTELSEGRGTTRPFEIFGAPFIDPFSLEKRLRKLRLPGVIFRPLYFLPSFQKHATSLCGGCQLHVIDRQAFRPFLTAAAVLKSVIELYPHHFKWKSPPYEYEYRLMPIDILAGSDSFRKDLEKGVSLKKMAAGWDDECADFDKRMRKPSLLYS